MSMGRRFGAAVIAGAALLVAGCGGQSASSEQSGGSGRSKPVSDNLGKQRPARQYLVKRGQKREGDYEGPDKPVRGSNPRWSYHVVLTGNKAVPRGPSSSAPARVTLRGRKVCWRFGSLPRSVSSSAAFGPVRKTVAPTAAGIHMGAEGKTGPAVVVFGARYRPQGCIVVRPVVVNAIASAPRFFYVNLVTAAHPKGALRAQL
jgi:CHRD domain